MSGARADPAEYPIRGQEGASHLKPIEKTYVPDLWCYGSIIVELKAVEAITSEHLAQIDNYLKLTKCRLGLLVNFGSYPKATIRRWAN